MISLPRLHLGQRVIGLFLGVVLFVGMTLAPAPSGLSPEGWSTAGVAVLMAILWASEAIPVPATALLPLVLFPLLGIATIKSTSAPYAHPLIFLFLGGFLIALAMQRWNLHKRLALHIINIIGQRPQSLIIGFMLATAFLSMWVSNTATTMMMLPVALSITAVIAPVDDNQEPDRNIKHFCLCLMLGIAYSASIGGIATLVGTPPNALLAAFLSDTYGIKIGFAEWMMIGLPLVVILLPLAWLVLTRLVYPFDLPVHEDSQGAISRHLEDMGPLTFPEKRVAVVAVLVALAWMSRPLLSGLSAFSGLTDTGIAITGALVLFFLPAGQGYPGPVIRWEDAKDLPWGVLLLFGGGLSLATAFSTTGLAIWLGAGIGTLEVSNVLVLILLTVALIIFLTELTSNTATTAAFLPVLGSIAIALDISPLQLCLSAAVAASCAFMLPVATPPNAIVFSSGHVTIAEMARAGLWLNIAAIAVITLLAGNILPIFL